MTLEQLRIFVLVAELQHVTKAAKALNLAQSAASHAISALEARHDARLFDRVGRRIELTEAGRVLLSQAKTILAQVEQAELMLGEFGKLERGTLVVHASQTIGGYWLPRHLSAFRKFYPGIEIRLVIGNTTQVAEAIENGAAELGFVEGEVVSETVDSLPIARDRLVLVVGPDHHWREGVRPDAKALKTFDWVLREPGSGTRSSFQQAIAGLGLEMSELHVVMELPSNEAVRGAVEAGLGAAALSASVVASSIEAGLLRQIPIKLREREYYALVHGQRRRSRLADAMLKIVKAGASSR